MFSPDHGPVEPEIIFALMVNVSVPFNQVAEILVLLGDDIDYTGDGI